MNRTVLFTTLAMAAVAAICGTAHADAPRWSPVADASLTSAYIDQGSVAALGDAKSVWVLRNYPRTIDLGSDPVTGTPWYPHRSVKVQYAVDCGTGLLALNAWEMHSGNFADGEVVWADRYHGLLAYAPPSVAEEVAALAAVCGSRTALR
jgi:hypothetical protein